MSVVIAIPWRATPDRQRAFDFVVDWYRNHLPYPIVTADSGPGAFSRARARNQCVRKAEGADVVVINDADTVPNLAAVKEAIHAAPDGLLHFGLDRMAYLDQEQSEAVYRGDWPDIAGEPHDSSVVVIRPASYWEAGGQDERFTGYGGEDNAFTAACTALLGEPVWHAGTALSLWHDGSCRDVGSARWWQDTVPLHQRYNHARNDAKRMRAIIAEREYQ